VENVGKQKLPRKIESELVMSCLSSVLDSQDLDVLIVRGSTCEVLYANNKADARMGPLFGDTRLCRGSFSRSVPDLCDYCPYGSKSGDVGSIPIEVQDRAGKFFSVLQHAVTWLDGKPATLFVLRDVTKEKETKAHLYSLAYHDQLTGVPNRQKLKDDFTAIEEKIINSKLTGAVALFDLDHFKSVNDTYGHNTGDLVLKRLTEHMLAEESFAGRLYRLGGDEFVLLFTDSPGKFSSDEELKNHYQHLLSTVLRSYTLPNIELQCTLSVGVSIFPKHGDSLSEILRKADIALYKAKAGGRNQVVFFEDQYDIAQKFKDLYVNIQPILLDTGKTYGYELNDRGNGSGDDDKTVNLSEFNRALDALGPGDIDNEINYFISYSKQLLNPAVLQNLPREKFIVQLPEKYTQNDIHSFVALRKHGYKLALLDTGGSQSTPELLALASYCKFSAESGSLAAYKQIISMNPRIMFIATKVDTTDTYLMAKAAGFHLFQGYFFNQPAITKKTKEVGPMRANYFRLMKLSSADAYMDFKEISEVISADVALTYKLLRILTSAAVGLRNVSNINMAVAYLGEKSLKKWIAVLALRGIAEDQPLELVRMSLIRARFGELLAPHFRIKRNPEQAFMVGMLSLLHIALDKSREALLQEIPVADDIRESLLTKTGIFSDLLRFYEQFEYANWDEVTQFATDHALDPQFVNDTYISAVKWYNDLTAT
jgi:EAL and modified HD-GYP domain-containing signal transduction protein